jgi:hypothetical protein
MIVIEGRLEYLGWRRPWNIETRGNKIDLSVEFWKVASALKDTPSAMEYQRDLIGIAADPASPFNLEYNVEGEGVIISRREGFGFSSVVYHCESIFCALNGREVIVAIEEAGFKVFANPQEVVPSVKFYGDGNMSRIRPGDERAVCGVATGDACIFLTASAKGFECAKFSSFARHLLDRKAEGTIRATRIGNCRNVGREETP